MFHAIDDRPSVISFAPKVFQRSTLKLHQRGYQTISLMKARTLLQTEKSFPEKTFAITFDDGYRSVYQRAFPVLHEYGMTATVFLTIGTDKSHHRSAHLPGLNGREMLNWQEIREMHQAEIEFGAHTVTHPDLTQLPLTQAHTEICESKKIIEDALGAAVVSFAYPYGYYTQPIREMVQQHFCCACSVNLGLVTKRSDPFALERVEMFYFRTEYLFQIMLTSWFPWYLRACNIPRQIRSFFQRRRLL